MWKTQSPLHQLTTTAGYARATSAHSAWPAGKFLSLFGLQASRFLGFSSQTSPATNSKLHLEDIKEVFNLKSPIRRSTSLRPSLRQGFAHCKNHTASSAREQCSHQRLVPAEPAGSCRNLEAAVTPSVSSAARRIPAGLEEPWRF